ncbi:hypothetical protein ACYSNX_04305 [Myroides sp. LJL115]
MLKKIASKILLVLLFLSSSLLMSCFDFIEEINISENGSGSIKATLNISQSKTQMATLLKLDQVAGNKIPNEGQIRQKTQEVVEILENAKGISNVEYTLDFTNYIAKLSCDFASVEDLNHFNATLAKHFNSTFSKNIAYSYDKKNQLVSKKFTYDPSYAKVLEKFNPKDIQALKQANYTQVLKFKQDIVETSHPLARISPSKKAVLLQVSVVDFIQGNTSLSNTIHLNKQ